PTRGSPTPRRPPPGPEPESARDGAGERVARNSPGPGPGPRLPSRAAGGARAPRHRPSAARKGPGAREEPVYRNFVLVAVCFAAVAAVAAWDRQRHPAGAGPAD